MRNYTDNFDKTVPKIVTIIESFLRFILETIVTSRKIVYILILTKELYRKSWENLHLMYILLIYHSDYK